MEAGGRKETEENDFPTSVASRHMARVFMDPMSAALAAKHRHRGPSVLERLRADEEAAAEKDAAASARRKKERRRGAGRREKREMESRK